MKNIFVILFLFAVLSGLILNYSIIVYAQESTTDTNKKNTNFNIAVASDKLSLKQYDTIM